MARSSGKSAAPAARRAQTAGKSAKEQPPKVEPPRLHRVVDVSRWERLIEPVPAKSRAPFRRGRIWA